MFRQRAHRNHSMSPLLVSFALAGLEFELKIPGAGTESGRAFVFVSLTSCSIDEPRNLVSDDQDSEQFFGKDVVDNEPGTPVVVGLESLGYPLGNMSHIMEGMYCIQGLFQPYEKYNRSDGHSLLLPRTIVNSYEGGALFSAPGTMYSKPKMAKLAQERMVLSLNEIVPKTAFPDISSANDTKYIKHVKIRSPKLSQFWGKEVILEATVLLPYGFDEHPEAKYPLFVYQGHYHGCYTSNKRMMTQECILDMEFTTFPCKFDVPDLFFIFVCLSADFATPVPFSEHPADPSLSGYEKVQADYAYYLFKNWTSKENSPFYKVIG